MRATKGGVAPGDTQRGNNRQNVFPELPDLLILRRHSGPICGALDKLRRLPERTQADGVASTLVTQPLLFLSIRGRQN